MDMLKEKGSFAPRSLTPEISQRIERDPIAIVRALVRDVCHLLTYLIVLSFDVTIRFECHLYVASVLLPVKRL